jgi:alkyl sulfatase BDS1-like metallo-beta-lactamase superfamily hydrolase
MAVCPAGEDVIAPFLADRKGFLETVVKPLQQKVETIYVTPDSDAEVHVRKRFPHKRIKRVNNGLRATSIPGFLQGIPLVFKKHLAAGKQITYHFTFTGAEEALATVIVNDSTLHVAIGHHGQADCHLIADSATWLQFLRKEANLLWAIVRRKIRVQSSPRLLMEFGRLFGG